MLPLKPAVVGRAGEYRVASELLLRGFRPLLATVDDGVDITLTNGVTIQVKTCRSSTVKNRASRYYVFTMHAPHMATADGRRSKRQRVIADYVILWCVSDDHFYVIPRDRIEGRHTINVPVPCLAQVSQCMWHRFRDQWDLLLSREHSIEPHQLNGTGFPGVIAKGSGFQARIGGNKQMRSLGVYPTAELAYEAYLAAKQTGAQISDTAR